ncbi:GNAT family N-acetyltransferase [Acrocarpospora catenulata]|uniref:GNAT family N-acetyltransferase n=1 Tax=Acrocarpospora catenulata TaxID=2836182 RepID=UPI001BDAE880|nr:GNAT family N-acetyltransferase [Acrocarpospora catenulata]
MITRLTSERFPGAVKDLAELFVDAVADGASIGFLAPCDHATAAAWWEAQATAVGEGRLVVWVSEDSSGVTGTVSLALEGRANGRHRAEILKLVVHRKARGQGLARALLATAERAADDDGRTLLLLDTQTGSVAESLYLRDGWTRYGVVPGYAIGPSGTLGDGSFLYKRLG